MLRSLNGCSKNRGTWILLALSAFLLELISLYFQHIMLLKPCVLCIYQRCALYGIVAAGLIGAIAPKTPLRFIGLLFWIYSAWKGLLLAIKHTDIQLHRSPFVTCDLFVNFPHWLPLDKWLPTIFRANVDCSKLQWHFLSLEIPQWMIIIFAVYLSGGVIIFLAQFFRSKKRNLFNR